jgi:hypothetical protein
MVSQLIALTMTALKQLSSALQSWLSLVPMNLLCES